VRIAAMPAQEDAGGAARSDSSAQMSCKKLLGRKQKNEWCRECRMNIRGRCSYRSLSVPGHQ
jgi:hypothetical protein